MCNKPRPAPQVTKEDLADKHLTGLCALLILIQAGAPQRELLAHTNDLIAEAVELASD